MPKIVEKSRESCKRYYEKNKERLKEAHKRYYEENKVKLLEKKKIYNEKNKEKISDQRKTYYKTPIGRAKALLRTYKQYDEKYNRGECTLTPEWIVKHIFSQPCVYCGESDWTKIGCDRKNNSLPHTPDNVVPCCGDCNIKRKITPYDEYLKIINQCNTD